MSGIQFNSASAPPVPLRGVFSNPEMIMNEPGGGAEGCDGEGLRKWDGGVG